MWSSPRAADIIRIMLCSSVAFVNTTTLVVSPEQSPHTNPLGRTVTVCATPEMGFLQHVGGVSFTATDTTPQIFTAAADTLRNVYGFDVDMLERAMSSYLGWQYEIHVYATYKSAFYQTRIGNCDIAMGVFRHTESRAQCFATPSTGQSWGNAQGCPLYSADSSSTTTTTDLGTAGCCGQFLSPYFPTGLAIMRRVPLKTTNEILWEEMGSPFIVNWLSTLLGGILLVGHIAWWLERTPNAHGQNTPMFPQSLTQGGNEGTWWALVTTTTVGYGDKTVKSGIARVITAIWMCTGFMATACIIGTLASALTTPEAKTFLLNAEGLSGKLVCAYSDDASEVEATGGILNPAGGVSSISDCFTLLKDGSVTAVVSDRQLLLSHAKFDSGLDDFMVGSVFSSVNAGPVVPMDSVLYYPMQWALSKVLLDQAVMTSLKDTWFPQSISAITGDEKLHLFYLLASVIGWVIYLIFQLLSLNIPLFEKIRLCMYSEKAHAWHEFFFGTAEERAAHNAYKDLSSRCCTTSCWGSKTQDSSEITE